MADADTRCTEAVDFDLVEMDAVGQPGLRAEPADTFQVIDAAHAETADAGLLFVWRFAQVGMQAQAVGLRQFGAGAHQFAGHRKG